MGLSAATAERAIDFPPDFGSELTSSQSTAAAENTEVDSADNYAVARLPVCFSSFVATAVRGAGGGFRRVVMTVSRVTQKVVVELRYNFRRSGMLLLSFFITPNGSTYRHILKFFSHREW